ncbi:ferritin-like domain-containing protein [Streptomyces sclerotialus]|uniref:ferritin-like domain-containing protein n=1 Tax=Streptomyces sclerotialus TaxID=1957 RepID=UPI0004C9A4BB
MTVVEYRSNAIVELMQVSEQDCDERWLKKALQAAIMVELATIPPYACGLWSIKDPAKDRNVFSAIREILFDEMTHLGRVGNILSALGEQPVLADPKSVPEYPGALPGGVRPELTVQLSGLDKPALRMFSEIEKPDRPLAEAAAMETYTSIGAFYSRIRDVLRANKDLFREPGPQIDYDMSARGLENSVEPIRGWEQADRAIEAIMQQGEGTTASPENPFPGKKGELAHYYVFLEIHQGRRLINVGEKWEFRGEEIPMPSVYPMAKVPKGGWATDRKNAPTGAVKLMVEAFNAHYGVLLRSLEAAWREQNDRERNSLVLRAIASMSSMRALARVLMQLPLPGNAKATYGPEFRYSTQNP